MEWILRRGSFDYSKRLKACYDGLGHGETAIFPIHIFRVKEGVNYNPGDPNYDLFRLACEVSAKRLFPNSLLLMHLLIYSIIKKVIPKRKFPIWVAAQE